LVWYLGKKVKPNLELLNNAIEQTEVKPLGITDATLKDFMLERLGTVDFAAAVKDVRRFVMDDNELRFIDRRTLESMISSI